MDSMDTIIMDQQEHQDTPTHSSIKEEGQSTSQSNMQLLSVPGAVSTTTTPGSPIRDSKFLRRYSCNPQGKGLVHSSCHGAGAGESAAVGTSSPVMRRSSLAAIKWSVLARRISMGLAHDREPPEDPTKAVAEVNTQVALLRDLLIHIGQSRDGPEMREKIRRIRRQSIEACRHAVQIILQQIHNDIASADGIAPIDFSPQLVLLFFCTQLLLKELRKCKRLILQIPVDMSTYGPYADPSRPGTSNFAGMLSQIILCRQINPDFNQEELCSIEKDTEEISSLLDDLQEFMPLDNNAQVAGYSYEEVFGRRSRRRRSSWCDLEALCCISKARRIEGLS